MKVNFPEVPRGGELEVMGPKIRSSYKGFIDTPHKIYAGNLSWGVTSQSLRDAFESQPGLLSAKVVYERDTGRSRGFGFVSFESAETAEAAVSTLNGVVRMYKQVLIHEILILILVHAGLICVGVRRAASATEHGSR